MKLQKKTYRLHPTSRFEVTWVVVLMISSNYFWRFPKMGGTTQNHPFIDGSSIKDHEFFGCPCFRDPPYHPHHPWRVDPSPRFAQACALLFGIRWADQVGEREKGRTGWQWMAAAQNMIRVYIGIPIRNHRIS